MSHFMKRRNVRKTTKKSTQQQQCIYSSQVCMKHTFKVDYTLGYKTNTTDFKILKLYKYIL